MEIKKRPTALALFVGYLVWDLVIKPIWTLNIERLAERQNLDSTLSNGGVMDWIYWLSGYVPSSFGLGFVTGGVIFAYWDSILVAIRRRASPQIEPQQVKAKPDIRAWVGNMVPYFDLKEDGYAKLRISIIGVGHTPFRVSSVTGNIEMKYVRGRGGQAKIRLPSPLIDVQAIPQDQIKNGHYFNLWLFQPIPPDLAREIPDTFGWPPPPSLHFGDLEITLISEDGSATKRLKLWDSMRLQAGENLVRYDETMPLFPSEQDREKIQQSLGDVVRRFGAK